MIKSPKLFIAAIISAACFVGSSFAAQSYLNQTLDELTVTQMQQKLAAGELSSEALVQYYLDRIALLDDSGIKLNAVGRTHHEVLAQARKLDEERQDKGSRGPLHGVPVLLKDNIDTNDGIANTAGSVALRHNYPSHDAFLVKRLRDAGAIILGKANLSEWANFRSTRSSSGWSGMYGQAKNPYDITRSPCGSSSGSAIAVAANLTLLAIGTETDGSVVCPASINGVVGIKPTLGTVSRSGIIPIAHSQDTAGPMARTVSDAVQLLEVMVGFDDNDKNALKSDIQYTSHLKADGLKGKRIGVVRNFTGFHPQVDALFEQAIATMKAQGAIIVDNANIDNKGQWDEAEFEVLLYEFKADLNAYLAKTDGAHPKSLEALIAFNKRHSSTEMPYFAQELFEMAQQKGPLSDKAYQDALAKAKRLAGNEGIDATMKKYQVDLLIAPTTGPAWKIDLINEDHYSGGSASSAPAVSGYPHITVPMGFVSHLPVGISFFAGQLQEGRLIEAAYHYEQASKKRQKPQYK